MNGSEHRCGHLYFWSTGENPYPQARGVKNHRVKNEHRQKLFNPVIMANE